MAANILPFKTKVTSEDDVTGGVSISGPFEPFISTSSSRTHSKDNIPTEELYPLREELHPNLARALQLLSEGISSLDVAVDMYIDDNLMSSDDSLMKFQSVLPELFCCRELGDGFGSTVNAIYHALNRREGIPVNLDQLKVIRKVVNRIYTEPFIEFEEAVDQIMELEKFGLEIGPEYIKFATDLLND